VRYELRYGPYFDLERVTADASVAALAALFEVIGFLIDNPFPGQSPVQIEQNGPDYTATFRGGLLTYTVIDRAVVLGSVILLETK
jgi:hypothetical protein